MESVDKTIENPNLGGAVFVQNTLVSGIYPLARLSL